MSHGCSSDVVPFVAHEIVNCRHNETPPDNDLWKILNPDTWSELYGTEEELEQSQDTGFYPTVRGWTLVKGSDQIGKKKRIWVNWITKGNFRVAEVNESPYSNVGEHTESICSDNRESIEAFLADFADCLTGKSLVIEETDVVEQWG